MSTPEREQSALTLCDLTEGNCLNLCKAENGF